MWSDRAAPEDLRALANGLRSVLPAPSGSAHTHTTALAAKASPEQVAEVLHSGVGFAWLRSRIFHQPLATVTYSRGRAVATGPGGAIQLTVRGFDLLQAMMAAWGGPSSAFLVGHLSYDLASELENLGPLPAAGFEFPQLHFGLYDSMLVFENGTWRHHSTGAWRVPIEPPEDLIRRAGRIPPPGVSPIQPLRRLTSHLGRAGFESAVARTVAAIHAGDIFQTNLCRCLESAIEPGAEWDLFRNLRSISPARYEAFLRSTDRQAVLSISPEQFLAVNGKLVESSPIKGTRARGRSPAEDSELAEALIQSEKDRAELAMIVDVTRNDLGRVCETGSIEVCRHAQLMTLPTVHHLFSTVQGRLRPDAGAVELLRAAFPAASITGAPKIEAMKIALREEGQERGPCMGAMGWISLNGDMELSVAIRTAAVSAGRVRYYAGGGITADSDPAQEFEETSHKAAAFVRALGLSC
jgi:para-aminobenzoate synthetase component 1